MVRWYSFDGFSCPIAGCAGNKQSINWVCRTCKTTMYIAESGYLRCEDSNHNNQIIKWRFNCGNHGDHSAVYQPADLQGFGFALSYAVQFLGRTETGWVAKLTSSLEKQYGV